MKTCAGQKQLENVQNRVIVQSVEISASAVVTGSRIKDSGSVIEKLLFAGNDLEVEGHDTILNDVLPKPDVGSAGNLEGDVRENDVVTSGDDVFLKVSPCSLDDVSGEDDEGKQWIIFYSCEEGYMQVLEDTESACDRLENSKLSDDVDLCSRAKSFEARVTPTDLRLSFPQVKRSSTVAIHESLGLECADRRKIFLILVEGMHRRESP